MTGTTQGSLKDGKWEGTVVENYDNGQLKSKVTVKDGEIDSPYVFYHENGTLQSKVNFIDGKERVCMWNIMKTDK